MNEKTGILFDLDGVIIDSEGLYTAFWEKTEKVFPTGIPDFAHAIKGMNLEKILNYFPEKETRESVLQRIHDFDRDLTYPLFPGAMELLRALKRRNIPRALYSSSNPEKMQRLFTVHPALKEMFDVIVNGSMVSRSKPDPEGYLIAARALGCEPSRCVVVEDSMQGVKAGVAAGATVAAIAGTVPREKLLAETPHVFNSIADLSPDILLNLLS